MIIIINIKKKEEEKGGKEGGYPMHIFSPRYYFFSKRCLLSS